MYRYFFELVLSYHMVLLEVIFERRVLYHIVYPLLKLVAKPIYYFFSTGQLIFEFRPW